MRNKFLLITLSAFLLLTQAAFAFVNPDEQLADAALESRARVISKDIRCPVCEGQTIDESNADLARDLRILIRERLTAGDSDEEVVQYLRLRYGDAILMNPRLNKTTALLWFGPFAVFALGGAATFAMLRKAQKS
ncbi:MAG TPA: cytochrome C biogenesis protein CcmH [Rhodospirillaceae bacterium]|nr:cytochrome C biogenesis protein CcmH [Rhodospirillaceae bacterium]